MTLPPWRGFTRYRDWCAHDVESMWVAEAREALARLIPGLVVSLVPTPEFSTPHAPHGRVEISRE